MLIFVYKHIMKSNAKQNDVNKSTTDKQGYEGNLYDKIFKENAESIFLPIIEAHLGIKIKKFSQLKEKLQTTLEREVDFLYKIETLTGEIFVLHIEFQTEDDPEMLYRNAEYHGIILKRKKLPIKHIVIFLGSTIPQMPTQLPEKAVYSGFDLITINQLDSAKLLTSQIPEEIILAILANYPKEQVESILRLIVRQLKAICANTSEVSKYFKQLVVLSRLRKIDNLTIKITEEMPINYDVQTDYLYQKGIEKGIEISVSTLILETDFSDERIAKITGATILFVKAIREKIVSKNKN
jgi:hypothetical protein